MSENDKFFNFAQNYADMKFKNLLMEGDSLDALTRLTENNDLVGQITLAYFDPPTFADDLNGPQFMEFLYPRLQLVHKLLSPSGSLYMHCDSRIMPYARITLDGIFGPKGFRNDITRIKSNPRNLMRANYGSIKDTLLFYVKQRPVWNDPRVTLSKEEIERTYPKTDAEGRRYSTTPLHSAGEAKNPQTGGEFMGVLPPEGKHWRYTKKELKKLQEKGLIEWSSNGVPRKKIYADTQGGKKLQDVWEFKDPLYPVYPGERNREMLATIIEASSNPGDIVLDCFAGSGGALIEASQLKRKWIGIDNAPEAIAVIKERLAKESGRNFSYNFEEV